MGAKRDPSVGNMAGARRGTPGSERRTSSVSPLAAVAPLTCGFLHPAQLLWSGGHFPLEGEGVTLAVCGGRGGRGRAGGRLFPQPATKGRAVWLPLPLGAGGSRTDGSLRWWGGGGELARVPLAGQRASWLLAQREGLGGRSCQMRIGIELLRNNFAMEEEDKLAAYWPVFCVWL